MFAMLQKIDNFVDRAFKILCYAGGIFTFFLMLLIVGDVIGRQFFGLPILGTAAFARSALIGIIFISLPYITFLGKHLRSEVILERAKNRFKWILEFISRLIGLTLFLLYSISLYKPTAHSVAILEKDIEGMTFIPVYPFHIISLAGAVLCVVAALRCCLHMFGKDAKE
jgi:TRAP-type C4-dicarboxylate transport system permease small subunit